MAKNSYEQVLISIIQIMRINKIHCASSEILPFTLFQINTYCGQFFLPADKLFGAIFTKHVLNRRDILLPAG